MLNSIHFQDGAILPFARKRQRLVKIGTLNTEATAQFAISETNLGHMLSQSEHEYILLQFWYSGTNNMLLYSRDGRGNLMTPYGNADTNEKTTHHQCKLIANLNPRMSNGYRNVYLHGGLLNDCFAIDFFILKFDDDDPYGMEWATRLSEDNGKWWYQISGMHKHDLSELTHIADALDYTQPSYSGFDTCECCTHLPKYVSQIYDTEHV